LCGIARRVHCLAELPITGELIRAAERYADGEITSCALEELRMPVIQREYFLVKAHNPPKTAFHAALATTFEPGSPHVFDVARSALGSAAYATHGNVAEWAAQTVIVKDVLGNPFRPASISSTWQTPTVTSLAAAAYEERALPSGELDPVRLAVL